MKSIHVESIRLGVLDDITVASKFLDALRDRFGLEASTTTMGTIEIYGTQDRPRISKTLAISASNYLAGWNSAYRNAYEPKESK